MIFNNNNMEILNDDIDDFIQGQVAKKTLDSNDYALSVFKRYMDKDKREIEFINLITLS